MRSLTAARMIVPCCKGLVHVVQTALEQARPSLGFKEVVIGIQGEIAEEIEHQPKEVA